MRKRLTQLTVSASLIRGLAERKDVRDTLEYLLKVGIKRFIVKVDEVIGSSSVSKRTSEWGHVNENGESGSNE